MNMTPEFNPLDEAEFDLLDDFLLNRIDDDQWQPGMDGGVLDLSMLDGFLTAIVSAPDTLKPSQWLPALWGDFEPEWKSEKQFESIFTLLMRYMNSLAQHLMIEPETFEPMFNARMVDDKEYLIVDEWCEGYMRAVKLNFDAWNFDQPEVQAMISPINLFTVTEGAEDPIRALNDDQIEALQLQVTPSVKALHAYYLKQRSNHSTEESTFRHEGPRPGRNDLCPCGSGKKYKKCCLH